MTVNQISYHIRGAIFDVYNNLGPGLLESVYHAAMIHELDKRGLKVESKKKLDVMYDGKKLPLDFELDLLVEDKVIVELKSVLEMKNVFYLQTKTYLKIANKKLGILVNFNCEDITENIHRIVNGL